MTSRKVFEESIANRTVLGMSFEFGSQTGVSSSVISLCRMAQSCLIQTSRFFFQIQNP